jgi:hypothetical protein
MTGAPWDASYPDGPAPWDVGRVRVGPAIVRDLIAKLSMPD